MLTVRNLYFSVILIASLIVATYHYIQKSFFSSDYLQFATASATEVNNQTHDYTLNVNPII